MQRHVDSFEKFFYDWIYHGLEDLNFLFTTKIIQQLLKSRCMIFFLVALLNFNLN